MYTGRETIGTLLSCGMLLVTVGCGSDFMNRTEVIAITPQTVHQIQSTPWDGPRARVAVIEFTNETGVLQQTSQHSTTIQVVSPAGGPTPVVTTRDPIGSGMRTQLITALVQTGAFIVLERGRGLEDVVREQDGIPGRMREETLPETGVIEGAQFLIYGAVTEYEPAQASVAGGIGINPFQGRLSDPTVSPGNVLVQIFAATAAGAFAEQAHIVIDIRMVDARTGRVVNATAIKGTPRDFGGAFGGTFGRVLVGIGGQYRTPIQKSIRACTIKAANWIAENAMAEGYLRRNQAASPEASIPRGEKDAG